jgi:hypothetical protein
VAPRKQLLLRINPELWEELTRWASDEFRSVNGQIEFLLKRAVEERRGKPRREIPDVASSEGPDPVADPADWGDEVPG